MEEAFRSAPPQKLPSPCLKMHNVFSNRDLIYTSEGATWGHNSLKYFGNHLDNSDQQLKRGTVITGVRVFVRSMARG